MEYNAIQNNQQQNNLNAPKVIPIGCLFLSIFACIYPWLMLGIVSVGLIITIFVCVGIAKRIYCLYLIGLIISVIKNVILSGIIVYFIYKLYDDNESNFFTFIGLLVFLELMMSLVIEPYILIKFKDKVKDHCNSNMNEVTPFINNQGMNCPNNPIPNGFNPYLAGENIPPIIPNSYQDMNNPNNIPPIIPNSYQDMNSPNNITPMKNDINQNNISQSEPNRNIDEYNNVYQPPPLEDLNNQDNLNLPPPMKNENNQDIP